MEKPLVKRGHGPDAVMAATVEYTYRKTSSISRTKPQNLNVSHLVLQLSLPNSLKTNVKLRMKM